MKKIIANILIVCIIMCCFSAVSFADEPIEKEYVVAGTFEGAPVGSSVSLFVLHDGVTMDELQGIEGSIFNKVCHMDTGITGADGVFRIALTVSEEDLDKTCVITCNASRQTGALRDFIPSLNAVHIYVSSEAVGGSGTEEDPFGSIQDAISLARTYSARGNSVEILFMGGEYRVTETVTISDMNQISPDSYIRLAPAVQEDKVVINGMKKIPSSSLKVVTDSDTLSRMKENARGKVYSVNLFDEGFSAEDISFLYSLAGGTNGVSTKRSAVPPSLYLNNKRQNVAQYPNEGWLESTSVGNDSTTSAPWMRISSSIGTSGWENAYVVGFLLESFRVKYAKIESMSSNILGKKLVLDGTDTLWSNKNGLKTYGPRFVVCNIIEEMDIPGEWCIDEETGDLFYFAPYALTESDVLEMPYVSTVMNISRTPNVTIENLEIKGAREGTVVNTNRADYFNLLNCDIHASAKYGVGINNSVESLVDSCNVYDIGGRAIAVYGGADMTNFEASGNVVSNNHVYDYSNNPSLGSSNMGISLGRGDGVFSMGDVAEHNLVHGGKYAGGFIYGGMDNKVQYNEIYNVITDTQDAGAIYAGRRFSEYGNLVAYNYIHDFSFKYNQRYANRAIYWDDYQSGQTAVGNIIVADSSENTAGILTIGADNVIRGNILVNIKPGITLGDRLDWVSNFAPGNESYDSFQYAPPAGTPHYDKMMALKAKLDANPSQMVYDAIAENNVLVNSTMSISEGLYDGKSINNISLSGDVFTDLANSDYTIASSVASANGISSEVPTESTFSMDSIGIQKNVPFTNHEFKLMYPVNGAKVSDSSIFLTWEQAVFADRYDYVIARDRAMTDIVLTGSTRETFIAPNLSEGTYYWKVTAVNTSRNMGRTWANENGVCSFTVTSGMPLEIADICVPSAASLKDFDVEYTIYNRSTSDAAFAVVAAIYNKADNSFVAAKSSTGLSCEKGKCITDTVSFSLENAVDSDKVYVRVFVLDNLTSLSPKSYSKTK